MQYKREHLVDLSELKGASRLGKPSLLAIARSLEKIQSDIHSLTNGSRRLKVDAFSTSDRDLKHAEWESQRASLQKSDSGNSKDES